MNQSVKPAEPYVSVFTPTFNRADKIGRVFESLIRQTCPHHLFEWIVIDDGSTDGTKAVIDEFKAKADFSIVYQRQENSGKHVAHNKALSIAKGELFLKCDSDDAFDPESISYFVETWDARPLGGSQKIAGISVRCRNEYGKIVTPAVIRDPFLVGNSEAIILHGISGDGWGIIRTDVAREFLFPEQYAGSHYPELILWNKLGRSYKEIRTNKVLYTIYYDAGNSITRSELVRDFAKASHKALRESADFLNNDLKWILRRPLFFVKRALLYNFHRNEIGAISLDADQQLSWSAAFWCALWWPINPIVRKIFLKRRGKSG